MENPARLTEEYQRRIADAQGGGGVRQDVDALNEQIARLRRGIDRLIDGYAEGIISRPEFQPRVAGLKQRLGRLQGERKARSETLELERDLVLVIGRLEEFITRMRIGLDELDWNGRRDVVRALIRRIEIDHDNVDVVFRVPSRSPEGGGGPSEGAQPVPGSLNRQHCGNVHDLPGVILGGAVFDGDTLDQIIGIHKALLASRGRRRERQPEQACACCRSVVRLRRRLIFGG